MSVEPDSLATEAWAAFNAEPGTILTGPQREFARTWPNQTEVTIAGIHFIQEDSPDEIGQAIADWMLDIRAGQRPAGN